MRDLIKLILIGFSAGTLSGMLGISGSVLVVPCLVYLMGWNQHVSQGTALSVMVLPVTFFAVDQYHQEGMVDIPVAGLLAVGMFAGGYVGGTLANRIPSRVLQKMFGVLLLGVSLKMLAD